MIAHIDIVGIGNKTVNEPQVEMDTLEEYMTVAKKSISAYAPKFRLGLAEEMLNNDDAVCNIAHSIMLADWQFDGRGSKYGFRKERAHYAIKCYMSRQKKESDRRMFRLDNIMGGSDSNATFAEVLMDKNDSHCDKIENNEEGGFVLKFMDTLIERGKVTEKGVEYVKSHYMDGVPVSKIATDDSLSRQSVYSLMDRTIKIVKNCLKEELFQGV